MPIRGRVPAGGSLCRRAADISTKVLGKNAPHLLRIYQTHFYQAENKKARGKILENRKAAFFLPPD
jgi:hypothetical protein